MTRTLLSLPDLAGLALADGGHTWGLGFSGWGLGFGVWNEGLGFGVWDSKPWVESFGFGVWGLGFQGLGFVMRV